MCTALCTNEYIVFVFIVLMVTQLRESREVNTSKCHRIEIQNEFVLDFNLQHCCARIWLCWLSIESWMVSNIHLTGAKALQCYVDECIFGLSQKEEKKHTHTRIIIESSRNIIDNSIAVNNSMTVVQQKLNLL